MSQCLIKDPEIRKSMNNPVLVRDGCLWMEFLLKETGYEVSYDSDRGFLVCINDQKIDFLAFRKKAWFYVPYFKKVLEKLERRE